MAARRETQCRRAQELPPTEESGRHGADRRETAMDGWEYPWIVKILL